jgi:hypothetical protein
MNGSPAATAIAQWILSPRGQSAIESGDESEIAGALDELMRQQWERSSAASGFARRVIRFHVDNDRWPTRAEMTAMLTAVDLPEGVAASLADSLPIRSDDSATSEKTAWVVHTASSDRYHLDPDCPNAKGGKRVPLAVAMRQLNSQPAKCCSKKKPRTPA